MLPPPATPQLKPRHLSEAKLRRPSKKTKTTEKLGDLKAKKVNYDVYTLGTDDGSEQANDIGAGEMKSLIPLLANKQRRYSSGERTTGGASALS